MRAVLRRPRRRSDGRQPSAAGRALGIACGTEKGSYVATAAEVSKAAAGFRVERLVVVVRVRRHRQSRRPAQPGRGRRRPGSRRRAVRGDRVRATGKLTNGTMEQYRVPRFKDMPPIEVVLLDRHDLPSAGAGETPIVCVAPAIGSAARAFGQVADALPVSLEG